MEDNDFWKAVPQSGQIRRHLAQVYAIHFQQEVLPLIYSMDERDQLGALIFETKRLLEAYETHLANACDTFEKMAKEALNTSLRPNIFLRR